MIGGFCFVVFILTILNSAVQTGIAGFNRVDKSHILWLSYFVSATEVSMSKRSLFAVVATVLCYMFFVPSVSADNNKPKAREGSKDYKWIYFAALPVYYFGVEIPLHESTHGLAASLGSDYKVVEFKPYLHYDSTQETFLFGSVSMVCDNQEKCPDQAALGKIALAPYVMTSSLFVTSDILLATDVVEPTSVSGRVMYFAGMVVPWFDFTYNTFWATDASDNAKVAESFGMSRSSVVAGGALISAAGAWRLWNGYKRAFPKRGQVKDRESNVLVTPMGGAETFGVSIHVSF